MFSVNTFIVREMRPKRRKTFFTVILLGFIIAVFMLGYFAFGDEETGNESLVQIHVLFRHGERTPSFSYPNDPHVNYVWTDGFGSLTNKGKLSMFNFGSTLRAKYKSFLGEYFVLKELSVLSSYAPRCQMSALTFLAGLFPPVGSQIWNKNLLWQPININPIPRHIDNMIAAKAPCKAFSVEKKKSDEELHGNLTGDVSNLFLFLSDKTGLTLNKIEQLESLYSTLKIENEHELEIPDWAEPIYSEQLKKIAVMNLESYTRTPLLKRLQAGPLLKKWLENMKTKEKKLHLFSGHDLTLINLLRTIGFTSVRFPPDYGAAFILELHHISGENIVKALYYNSSSDSVPIHLSIPDCDPNCTLEKLSNLMETFIPEDWEKECNEV